jgi:hypothetical protein
MKEKLEELKKKAILNINGNINDPAFLDRNVFVLQTRKDLSDDKRTRYITENQGIFSLLDKALIDAYENGYFDEYKTEVLITSIELDKSIYF